jgi:HKD family nuclease
VCSPWISKVYAEKLYDLSRKGIEVRIITSDDEYNSATFSYLSQLLPNGSNPQSTNFDVHFVKKDTVHSKIYVVDENYAVTGAVNFTYNGLCRQTNNFTIAENQEVEPIIKDFMRLWIGFKSENVQPTQSTIKNMLPIIPYEKAAMPKIENAHILEKKSAKLIIKPYYRIQYSLLETVRLPWYQQTVVEDRGTVVIDASSSFLLNRNTSINQPIIREINNSTPLKETTLNASDKYEIENHEWDIKIDSYKAEQLARNYIQEKNRRDIPYNDKKEGQKYLPYLPSQKAITILSKDLHLLPTWHFEYSFRDKKYEQTLLASSGQILKSSFNLPGVICEDCGNSISKNAASHCSMCNRWICPSEINTCSSCKRNFHRKHIEKICPICHEIICNECLATCPICKKEYGKNHLVNCHNCGVAMCSSCSVTSGLIIKKNRCPTCEAYQNWRRQ